MIRKHIHTGTENAGHPDVHAHVPGHAQSQPHEHPHAQGHHYVHLPSEGHGRAFMLGIGLNVLFVGVEVLWGFKAHSSALLADAGHNASDVMGLVLAWMAAGMAALRPRGRYTFGFRKTTILAALINALLLFGAVWFIVRDAIAKLMDPQPVSADIVMVVAAVGVVVNAGTAWLFFRGRAHDLNIRGAFLHMATDAAVSLGVVLAGLLMRWTGHLWIDPATSLLVVFFVLWATWRLFTQSVDLVLDAVPAHIPIAYVRAFMLEQPEVKSLHDLHIWAMSTTQVALTVHLVVRHTDQGDLLPRIRAYLKDRYGIEHTTFQIEDADTGLECAVHC